MLPLAGTERPADITAAETLWGDVGRCGAMLRNSNSNYNSKSKSNSNSNSDSDSNANYRRSAFAKMLIMLMKR